MQGASQTCRVSSDVIQAKCVQSTAFITCKIFIFCFSFKGWLHEKKNHQCELYAHTFYFEINWFWSQFRRSQKNFMIIFFISHSHRSTSHNVFAFLCSYFTNLVKMCRLEKNKKSVVYTLSQIIATQTFQREAHHVKMCV